MIYYMHIQQKSSRGAFLIISMILLIVLSGLGIATMTMATTDNRGTRNYSYYLDSTSKAKNLTDTLKLRIDSLPTWPIPSTCTLDKTCQYLARGQLPTIHRSAQSKAWWTEYAQESPLNMQGDGKLYYFIEEWSQWNSGSTHNRIYRIVTYSTGKGDFVQATNEDFYTKSFSAPSVDQPDAHFCEGHSAGGANTVLSCNDPPYIHVTYAFYGRKNTSTCTQGPMGNTNCVLDITNGVKADCNNKKSCSIEKFTHNSYAGDPCVGTYKYVQVEYRCKWTQTFKVDSSNINSTGNGFSTVIENAQGNTSTIVTHGSPPGFGVAGAASGADSELGYSDAHGSEVLTFKLDADVSEVDVSFAWKHSGENAQYDFYKDGVRVGGGIDYGGSDGVDPAKTLSPGGDVMFDEVRFSAPGSVTIT